MQLITTQAPSQSPRLRIREFSQIDLIDLKICCCLNLKETSLEKIAQVNYLGSCRSTDSLNKICVDELNLPWIVQTCPDVCYRIEWWTFHLQKGSFRTWWAVILYRPVGWRVVVYDGFSTRRANHATADDLREEQIWDQDGLQKKDLLTCSCMIFPQITCLVFFRPLGQIFDDTNPRNAVDMIKIPCPPGN